VKVSFVLQKTQDRQPTDEAAQIMSIVRRDEFFIQRLPFAPSNNRTLVVNVNGNITTYEGRHAIMRRPNESRSGFISGLQKP
jgi:hypothetical protein